MDENSEKTFRGRRNSEASKAKNSASQVARWASMSPKVRAEVRRNMSDGQKYRLKVKKG